MKTKFPGHFKLSEDEIRNLWDNALFTLDANILLNLYRYSDETKTEFIKILQKLKDRIWIPNQSAQEFFENRLNVISQQEKSYEETISTLNTMEKEFKNSRQHPFLSKKLLKRFSILTKEMSMELNDNKDFHSKRIIDDDILEEVESLFSNKVGNEFTEKELEELYKIGETRFVNKTPPGYKDSGKKDNTPKDVKKYGDFLVWKQLINKSKEIKKGIILVTDDRKEDWWVRFKGKTLQPRPELIREFNVDTEQTFHMYQSDRFLEFARDYLNEDVTEKAIEEIRELRRLDERKMFSKLRREQEVLKYQELRESSIRENFLLNEQIKNLNEKKKHIKNLINEQYLSLGNGEQIEYDNRMIPKYKKEYDLINSEIEYLKKSSLELKENDYFNKIRKFTLHNNVYKK